MDPCISVIIPVYQAERFIAKAVKSACMLQEVFQVLIIEDGSTDNSLEICKELVNQYSPKVTLLRHSDGRNKGAGASRNLGIKNATCNFIAFLDADDYYLPGRFKHDLEILHANLHIDGVYNALGVHIYDKSEQDRSNLKITTIKHAIPSHNLFEEMAPIGRAGYFHGDTLTVRRDVFEKVGYFDTTLELSQDTQMWVKMAANTSLVSGIMDKPVAMRGVHLCNRIKDKVKFNYFRPLLFLSLFEWARNRDLPLHRKRLLWDRLVEFYYYSVVDQQIGKLAKKKLFLIFLVKHGFKNPHLLLHKNFLYSFTKLIK